jgi:hypothetical protein
MQPTSAKARLSDLIEERETLRIRLSMMRSGETYPSDEPSIAAASSRLEVVEKMIPPLRSEIVRDGARGANEGLPAIA